MVILILPVERSLFRFEMTAYMKGQSKVQKTESSDMLHWYAVLSDAIVCLASFKFTWLHITGFEVK